jgi:predicted RNA-binding Zn ribbon-like protein
VSFEDYDLNPVRLALDLASLGGGTISAEQLVERQGRMLTDHGYPRALAQISPRDLSRLRALGRELAGVLGTADQGAFVAALAVLLDAQDCRPQLTLHDGAGSPHLHYARDGAPLPVWVGTMAVSGLVLYVCRYGRSRLRPCAADSCGRWYADESKNASRRYCSATCASRTTVAAFRHRQVDAGRKDDPVGRGERHTG